MKEKAFHLSGMLIFINSFLFNRVYFLMCLLSTLTVSYYVFLSAIKMHFGSITQVYFNISGPLPPSCHFNEVFLPMYNTQLTRWLFTLFWITSHPQPLKKKKLIQNWNRKWSILTNTTCKGRIRPKSHFAGTSIAAHGIQTLTIGAHALQLAFVNICRKIQFL